MCAQVERLAQSPWKPICVPTSFQSRMLLRELTTLTVSDLDAHSDLDLIIDGADEVRVEICLDARANDRRPAPCLLSLTRCRLIRCSI